MAQAAGVSSDYCTRVEQGRLAPSPDILLSLCRVLRLSAEQTAYAEDLLDAARGLGGSRPARSGRSQRLQLLLDQITELPAVILGPRTDILAWNRLASALLTDFSRLPSDRRNYVSLVFTQPEVRALYEEWESVARTCVGILRREAAHNPNEPELAALVGRLSIEDEDFRRWWAEHRIAEQDFGSKTLNHPLVGRLTLDWDSFSYDGAERRQLVLWSTSQRTDDAKRLGALAESLNGP